MITKQHKFKISSGTLYGFAGAAFGVVTVGLMIQSQLAPETYPACSERYSSAGMFALERPDGEPMSPAEVQSRLAGREWGVLHNIAVKPEKTPDGNVAMTVKFEAGGTSNATTRRAASGVGFNWEAGYLRNANSACLSYSVRVPDDFRFANGGTLPGLLGQSTLTSTNATPPFSMRMRWLEGGKLGVQPVTPAAPFGHLIPLAPNWLRMPVDQWVSLEQEVVLNTPGEANGVLRIWVDGKLQLNLGGLTFRKDQNGFAGATADTHYSDRAMAWAPAPKPTEIKLSPMIVRWN